MQFGCQNFSWLQKMGNRLPKFHRIWNLSHAHYIYIHIKSIFWKCSSAEMRIASSLHYKNRSTLLLQNGQIHHLQQFHPIDVGYFPWTLSWFIQILSKKIQLFHPNSSFYHLQLEWYPIVDVSCFPKDVPVVSIPHVYPISVSPSRFPFFRTNLCDMYSQFAWRMRPRNLIPQVACRGGWTVGKEPQGPDSFGIA